MLIISDTSPITNLIQINQLELLEKLFDEVVIPNAVFQELAVYEKQAKLLLNCNWIVVKTVKNITKVQELTEILDLGEAEAIVLAKECKADLLIIDERHGRYVAKENDLEIIGLLGILVRAKQEGLLLNLKPHLDKLVNEIGFRVSKKLYQLILKSVNEI